MITSGALHPLGPVGGRQLTREAAHFAGDEDRLADTATLLGIDDPNSDFQGVTFNIF